MMLWYAVVISRGGGAGVCGFGMFSCVTTVQCVSGKGQRTTCVALRHAWPIRPGATVHGRACLGAPVDVCGF